MISLFDSTITFHAANSSKSREPGRIDFPLAVLDPAKHPSFTGLGSPIYRWAGLSAATGD